MNTAPSEGLLTRAECNALRGLAILGIFLHNYCHWLGPIVKENEFQFFEHNVSWLHRVLGSPDLLLPIHLISFFGHYGVPIFLFLSAYGLERKYAATGSPLHIYMSAPSDGTPVVPLGAAALPSGPGVLAFVRYHYLKLFKMMIVGFVCFTVVDAITPARWGYSVLQVVAQLGMFNNLLPQPDHNIWPGPYWFFGLMLQLYIVYRLLLYRRHWGWTAGLMVACVGLQLLLGPESEALNRYRYNFMGGMLPFGMGLLFARYGERIILLQLNSGGLLMSWVVTSFFIVAMSGNVVGWTFVPAFVCYAAIYFVKFVGSLTPHAVASSLMRKLVWMGSISAALFVIHPVLRKVFIPISRQGDIYAGLLLYVVASIAAAWLIREVMNKIPNPTLKS